MKPYAFSGWIANLGVVPLFSFAFFLLAPAFFLFNFLRILVCVVLEDIFLSLSYQFNKQYRAIFLTCFLLLVKGFIAQSTAFASASSKQKNIFLAKGEQIELDINNLDSFSIGNSEVVQCKYLSKTKKFLVKGKMLGFSDLIIKSGEDQIYHIYVTSKQAQLKKMEIAHALKGTGLEILSNERLIHISGVVKDLNTYFILTNIAKSPSKDHKLTVKLSPSLRNQIIGDIYKEFYDLGGEYLNCTVYDLEIDCDYRASLDISSFIKRLENKFLITFNSEANDLRRENFQIQFFILLKENSKQKLRNSGANKINADLSELVQKNQLNLKAGEILFQDENQFIKVLAQPEILTLPENDFSIELGSEIPFEIQTANTSSVNWKFAGLKLEGRLKLKNNQLQLKSKTQLTQGSEDSISGPKTQSLVNTPLDRSFQLANINLDQLMKNNKKVPILGDIPLLKVLFSEQNILNSVKSIQIYVLVSKRRL